MILALDVGNTNITCGVFDGDTIKTSFRITTKMPRTSDEYAMIIMTLLEKNEVSVPEIHDAIICSVVPNIMHSLQNALIKYFNIKPIIVGVGIKTGIRIATSNPQQIGADRIVDAVAAYELYGGPVIVIDFGTATTYDMVDAEGTFMGGITAPGIRISAKALWEDTAKLPEIEIKKPDTILGKDTITSMQSGLVYGQIGQTEYIIKKTKEETGLTDAKVVVTGGLGRIISGETSTVDVYDPDLTLKGINLVYQKFDAAIFKAGANNQIVQKYNPAKYPTAKVQNVAVNGEIWTGSGTTTKKTFPELSEISYENSKNITSSDNCPPENITSCVMKVSYGNFDFFAGGDLQYNGRSSHAWKDAELPCAKAVGQVELLKANHHGVTNTNQVDALKALNPQTIVVNSWVDCHPRTDILNSMETTLPACDMFITNFWQGDRPSGVDDRVTAEEAARVKGYDGHIVVRVTDGGNKYRVVTITDSDGAMTVKTISGPYTSR